MKTAIKLDLYKVHKADYAAPQKPVLLTLKPTKYLAISGQGEPGGDVFSKKIGALYGVAYTIKMTWKQSGKQDYTVCKLEAQWWAGANGCDFEHAPRDQWRWNLLIRTPDFIGKRELKAAFAALEERGKGDGVRDVALETLDEGLCVQMLHVGPYDRECETITVMLAHAASQGLEMVVPHHEIYLSDPRRVAPEKLKTILREPVRPIGSQKP